MPRADDLSLASMNGLMEDGIQAGVKYLHHKLKVLLFELLPVFITISILSWLNTYLMNSSIKPLTALNSFQVANDSAV